MQNYQVVKELIESLQVHLLFSDPMPSINTAGLMNEKI